MEQNPNKTKPQPQASVPPPRPPKGHAISVTPGDDDDDHNDRKKLPALPTITPAVIASGKTMSSTAPFASQARLAPARIERGLIIGSFVAGLIAVGTTLYCLSSFTAP